MADINHVILVGRLTKDAELKYTNAGSPLSKFSIAINKKKKVGDKYEDEAHFFDVTVWGKIAEALQPYLKKGKQVGVDGELRQNRWEQDGQARSKVEIVANNIQLMPGGSKAESPMAAEPTADNFEDDMPF